MAAIQAKICAAILLAAFSGTAQAQFNTLRRNVFTGYEILKTKGKETSDSVRQTVDTLPDSISLPVSAPARLPADNTPDSGNRPLSKKHLGFAEARGIHTESPRRAAADRRSLPELTVANLLAEIRRSGIRHEKVVLAQAILETGWFTSSVCRYKNNLFGLTNPRTGQYYEFGHWTESVRAYYDKVQYRYKGGNYLLWLKDIGYAEDPRYVSSLIRILRQYML